MNIAFFAEGSYPYVVGGVSGWSHMLMEHFRQHTYTLHTIMPTRVSSGQFRYQLPPNIDKVIENYLEGDDMVVPGRARYGKDAFTALRSVVLGDDDPDWEAVIRFLNNPRIRLDTVLMSPQFLSIVTELYEQKYSRTTYTDFLWTIRSMYLPLFRVLKGQVAACDLYQTVSTGFAGMLAVKGALLNKKPLLLTEHGIYTREREEEIIKADWTHGVYKDLWIEFFYKLSSCCYRYASQVVSLFETARLLQVEIGCPKEKTRVIPNGIHVERFLDLPGKPADDTAINIGAVLRVTPIKDVKTMINAFSIAKRQMPNLKLWIMGPTEEDEEYFHSCEALVKALDVKDVVFTGRVNVPEYLGKMDIMLLTSISEGQPLSLLEAMAARKPCIATRVGNCDGLLEGEMDEMGACGIITPIMNAQVIAQAIIRLAKDPATRDEMGAIGRKRAQNHYTHDGFLAQYDELYRKLGKEG